MGSCHQHCLVEAGRAEGWRVRIVPALARHPSHQAAQFWDVTCNVRDGQNPSAGAKPRPGLKTASEIQGWGCLLTNCRGNTNVLRSPELSPPKHP